jgi:hypothetical protein
VLDVERRIDIDAGIEKLLDIEIAFGMAAARRVAMRELVDQNEFRPALQDAIEGAPPIVEPDGRPAAEATDVGVRLPASAEEAGKGK